MITDVNVSLSRWPFRRLQGDELPDLVSKLHGCGVAQAWVGSFDGLFHKDVSGVNVRLANDIRQAPAGLLVPFGTVNPLLPDWREDVRRCQEVHRMTGIRLYPNYHGYTLDHPVFAELLELASRRGLVVQLSLRVEDRRMQHPLMRVPDVDTQPLAGVIKKIPHLRVVLLNALQVLHHDAITPLLDAGQVSVEISTLEGVGGLSSLLSRVPLERVLFGSHFPFFILESAVLKLQESDLTPDQTDAITRTNAVRLLEGVGK